MNSDTISLLRVDAIRDSLPVSQEEELDTAKAAYELSLLELEWSQIRNDAPQVSENIERLVRAGCTPDEVAKITLLLLGHTRDGRARRIQCAAEYQYRLLFPVNISEKDY